jgi:heme-degrading monooxygenase HmoA
VAVARTTKSFNEGQVMTVFRSRRRTESESAYQALAEEMETAARSVPGFVDFKTFTADDGERVSLVTFGTLEAHQVWRNDPRHRRAMKAGREEFYVEYCIQVGECSHVSQWSRGGDREN